MTKWQTDSKLYEGNYPLEPTMNSIPMKYWLYRILGDLDENGNEKIDIRYHVAKCKRFPDNMIMRFQTDKLHKNFDKWELYSGWYDLMKESAVERISKFCSADFQAVKIEIIPSKEAKEDFLIKDWYMIHFLVKIDMLDREKSFTKERLKKIEEVGIQEVSVKDLSQVIFYEDIWDGHYLADDTLSRKSLWHPRVAWELRNAKDVKFIRAGDRG